MNKNLETLRNQLNLLDWPNLYYYKFIIPNTPEMIAKVSAIFDSDSELLFHQSSKGNYTSLSVKELSISADCVIKKYEKAIKINGLIAL